MAGASFLWGVATSSYQIEGAVENDWTEWERLDRLKTRGERCGEGAGHRSRWRADLGLLPSLSANAYRFSLERSRIEPERGWFSECRAGSKVHRGSGWTVFRLFANVTSSVTPHARASSTVCS
jgi:hypothetical protein